MNVSLFVTCLVDQLYPDVGLQTVLLLRRLGCNVEFPKSQICCGQPAFNSGYIKEAREVAYNNLKSFEDADYVVTPSGSCAGMVHHYYAELFKDDAVLAKKSAALVAKTYELSQFIVNVLAVKDVGASFPHSVTYHPSCHGSRLLGVKDEPVTLLSNVKDIKLLPLPRSQDCCGFGGTFAVKLSGISGAMVAEKVQHITDTEAEVLVGTDMGCLMNISGSMKRKGVTVNVMHLAQLLNQGVAANQTPEVHHVS